MVFKNIFLFCKKGIDIESVISPILWLQKNNINVFVEPWVGSGLKDKIKSIQSKEDLKGIELIVVLGGDGAILRASQKVIESKKDIPILGINMGRLGFLTFGEGSFEQIIEKVLSDEFITETKPTIFASVENEKIYAVNDIVLRSSDERMREFEIVIGEESIGNIRADGVIISTQTGSTAYSLSVGGPIVFPGTDTFVVSFIAPFSLWTRPLVVPAKKQIFVRTDKSRIKLCADGNVVKELKAASEITIKYSENSIKILKDINSSFYKTLKEKMQWNKE